MNRIIHFLLFILACVAVHKRRKSRSTSERLEEGNDVDDVHKTPVSTTPKRSKPKHDLPGNTTEWATRNDLLETNGASWRNTGPLGQGVSATVEKMRITSPEFLCQSIPVQQSRSIAELPAITEAPI